MPALAADSISSVRGLIEAGKSKMALDRAKDVHKQLGTPESEALLIDAYAARVAALVDTRMLVEARSLAELVRQKFPGSAHRLEIVEGRAALRAGDLKCLDALADPDKLDPNRRDALHGLIRHELLSPAALAEYSGLPDAHPLRQTAKAIVTAFTAVTSGPVSEEFLQLRDVSHRSPLAPWKLLIQAIGALYRHDDETCLRLLGGLDPESAAARLKPAIEAIVSGRLAPNTPHAVELLVEQTGGGVEKLRGMLVAADAALRDLMTAGGQRSTAVELARNAIKAARRHSPQMATALEEQVVARLMRAGWSEREAPSQLGIGKSGRPNMMRLRALAYENGSEQDAIGAVTEWADFQQTAVRANIIQEKGPTSSELFLHMANLLRRVDPDILTQLPRRMSLPPELCWMFDCRALYQRAATADPCSPVYRAWLAWEKAENHERGKSAEAAALAWHRALPKDLEPLLYLADVLEERGALQKSLAYVAKAEAIDALNANVRQARARLLFRAACRSLKAAKPALVEKHTAAFAESAFAQQGDLPGLAWALRYCLEMLMGNSAPADRARTELIALMGQDAAAALIWNVAQIGQSPIDGRGMLNAAQDGGRLEATARICLLGEQLGVPFRIPEPWNSRLAAALSANPAALGGAGRLALGEAALRRANFHLAYAVSTAGLAAGGLQEARFLLLRARALPPFLTERRNQCLAAVVTMARRQRDNTLVSAAIEARRGTDRFYDDEMASTSDFTVSDEHLAALLSAERLAAAEPVYGQPGLAYVDKFRQQCMCPQCQAERRRDATGGGVFDPVDPFEGDGEEDDEENDEGAFDDELDGGSAVPPGMPAELARVLNNMPPDEAYELIRGMAKMAGVKPPPRSMFPGLGPTRRGRGK